MIVAIQVLFVTTLWPNSFYGKGTIAWHVYRLQCQHTYKSYSFISFYFIFLKFLRFAHLHTNIFVRIPNRNRAQNWIELRSFYLYCKTCCTGRKHGTHVNLRFNFRIHYFISLFSCYVPYDRCCPNKKEETWNEAFGKIETLSIEHWTCELWIQCNYTTDGQRIWVKVGFRWDYFVSHLFLDMYWFSSLSES